MADIVVTERKDIDFYSRINMAAVDENGTALSKGVFKLVNSSYGKGQKWQRNKSLQKAVTDI